MTTTTATSSTAATTKSAVQTATKSLLTSLGSGSGIDTGTLVTSLVDAQFAAQTARLAKKAETLTAQISGVSSMKSAITGFANALDTLAKGGSLATQPKSSTATVATATAVPGAKLSALSSTVNVTQIARAQAAASGRLKAAADPAADASRTTVLGSGTFTLQLGTAAYAADGKSMTGFAAGSATAVSFDLTDATPDTIAAAINKNAAKLGITAKVVTDADGGTYLSLKGATGAANAFTLTTTGDAALKQVEVGTDATSAITAGAQNAKLSVDGVAVERASNTVEDLVPGVKLTLTGPGTTELTADKPTDGIKQAVGDFVDLYNQVLSIVKEQVDPVTGNLSADTASQALLRGMKGLTLGAINPGATDGAPRTLAELGVETARDGTLSVDEKQLSAVLTAHPDAVEQMFLDAKTSATGLPAKLKAVSDAAASATYGFGSSTSLYSKAQADLAKAQAKITADSEKMTARLTSQYAALNSRVTAYKSIQTFMTGQIAAWNKSDS